MSKYVKSTKVILIEKIIKDELEKRKDEILQQESEVDEQTGIAPIAYKDIILDSFDCNCVYEATNEAKTTMWIEFLTLSCFDIEDENNNKKTKWIFLKIRFRNPELESEANQLKLSKTKIDFLRYFDDWQDAIDDFKREFNFYASGEGWGYNVHLDILNFKTFFADPTFYAKDTTDKHL